MGNKKKDDRENKNNTQQPSRETCCQPKKHY